MKKVLYTAALALVLAGCGSGSGEPIYKDASQPIEKRVEDLLGRMTLEEKVGQMNMYVGIEHIKQNEAEKKKEALDISNDAVSFYPGLSAEDVENITRQGLIGSFLHVLTIEEANHLQSLAMESRLQIPLIFGIDAIHGNCNAPDNTAYPTNIGMASTFNPDLAYTIAQQTAKEMRAMNMHWAFNPNVEVARDPRWSRVGETYGEDPYLVTAMGVATVKGYQGNLDSDENVLACVKHLVAGSQSLNGSNVAPADISERTLREIFFPSFEAGAKAGSATFMTAHNEINGVPCHSNKWLMQDMLRGEWGWDGIIVSDWMDIERMHLVHATAESYKEAFYQTIMGGMDVHMHGIRWQEMVCELVHEGRISEKRIDQSVRKILYYKFKLGLFEQPYADPEKTMEVRLNPEHRATALEAARQSIVLLKNDGILPLDQKKYRRVMLTGINANDQGILGDWSAPMKDENIVTILEGLKMVAPDTEIDFVDMGWDPMHMSQDAMNRAANAARWADLNIVVASEATMRFRGNERTNGENADRSDNFFPGRQQELLEMVAASGKPTILVITAGRPLSSPWAKEHIPAIVNAWEPGMYGGQAIAEILYGQVNPSGKISVTIPEHVGQIQMVYNHKPTHFFHPYVGSSIEPFYPFGHGLSYTTYSYSNMALSAEKIGKKGTVKVGVDVENTGKMDGVEIVQLYIRDCYSSVTRPVKELKDFARVQLAAGEKKRVEFTITPDKLQMLDLDLKPVVESGEFIVMVGSSSADKDLLKMSFTVE